MNLQDEIVRLRRENAELREKLNLAIEIVNEFIEKGQQPEISARSRLDIDSWGNQEKLKAAM